MTDKKLLLPEEKERRISTEESDTKHLLSENQHLKDENKALRSEVRFWCLFYSESIKLFGEKRDRFESVLKKAMKHIGAECRIIASNNQDRDGDKKSNLEQNFSSGFNMEGFINHCDEITKKDYGKKVPRRILAEYYILTGDPKEASIDMDPPPLMDKEEVINLLAKKYSFGSYSACYQCLKGYGAEGLPYFSE